MARREPGASRGVCGGSSLGRIALRRKSNPKCHNWRADRSPTAETARKTPASVSFTADSRSIDAPRRRWLPAPDQSDTRTYPRRRASAAVTTPPPIPPAAVSRPRLALDRLRAPRKEIHRASHHQELSYCHDHQVTYAPSPPSLEQSDNNIYSSTSPQKPSFLAPISGSYCHCHCTFFLRRARRRRRYPYIIF